MSRQCSVFGHTYKMLNNFHRCWDLSSHVQRLHVLGGRDTASHIVLHISRRHSSLMGHAQLGGWDCRDLCHRRCSSHRPAESWPTRTEEPWAGTGGLAVPCSPGKLGLVHAYLRGCRPGALGLSPAIRPPELVALARLQKDTTQRLLWNWTFHWKQLNWCTTSRGAWWKHCDRERAFFYLRAKWKVVISEN